MIMVYIMMGLIAGCLSGLLGVGGGIILVPAFVFILGMSQKLAQGTAIALMVPPISILAAITYWKQGNVDFTVAFWVCLGVVLGSGLGAQIVTYVDQDTLKKLFGILMLTVSIKLLFF